MNKRDEVLQELKNIAEVLNINIDYVVDEKREYLVCDDTKICTNETSISGIREEFFGYVFLKECKYKSAGFEKIIKKYWFDDSFNQPYL